MQFAYHCLDDVVPGTGDGTWSVRTDYGLSLNPASFELLRWRRNWRMPTVYFEDLEIGSVQLGRECVCDREEMLAFSRRNDPWPFHIDEAAAARSRLGGIIASGGYIVTLWYRMLIEIYNTPRASWALLGGLEWRFKFRAPVRAADTLRVKVTVQNKQPWIRRDQGVVTLFNEILNQRSEVVCTVEAIVLMANRAAAVAPLPLAPE